MTDKALRHGVVLGVSGRVLFEFGGAVSSSGLCRVDVEVPVEVTVVALS